MLVHTASVSLPIDLVVTDLDGTVWHTDDAVHPDLGRAWADVEAQVPVIVATGRRATSARTPLAAAGIRPPAVVINGALALDLGSGERFHVAPFAPEAASEILDAFRSVGVDPCLYVDAADGEVYVSDSPSTNPGHLASLGADAVVVDLERAASSATVLGFGVIGAEHRSLTAVADAIGARAEVHLDRSLDFPGLAAMTVAPLGQSKWDGVLAYCGRHDIDPSRVLALGDGPNDIELLTNAAVAVVPEGSHPSALELADHTIPSAGDAGWLHLPELLARL